MDINGGILKSDELDIRLGIPQGSIAGTIFFIFHINDFQIIVETIWAEWIMQWYSSANWEKLVAEMKIIAWRGSTMRWVMV